MKFLKVLGALFILLIVIYFLGPTPSTPGYSRDLPVLPSEPSELEQWVSGHEKQHKLKPDNEARIQWYNDSLKTKTEYAVVYLHGFSASQEEGDPVHYEFAKKFGCNLYLSRLADHGIDTTEPLLNFTAEAAWQSAKEAYMIGKQLGNKVILLATSTGGTLALKLAAEYPDIAGLFLLSPNIEINDSKAWMLNNPWGLYVARMVKGKYNESKDTSSLYARYWNSRYRMEATVELEELLESTMKESTFSKVTQPTLVLYYYRDDENQDQVVKVNAMKRMFRQLSTPVSQKKMVAVPGAGDHVIGSYIKSRDVQTVVKECEKFAIQKLGLEVRK